MKSVKIVTLLLMIWGLTGCGIQSIPKAKLQAEGAFAEITNQYKRRADLIPNLVKTVKGYASHEKETLEGVVNARAKATATTIDPSKATPEQLIAYQKAQGQLSQALGKLMMISERYPDLKASTNFLELQASLEGTENRIGVARNRYIQAVTRFNELVTIIPTKWTNDYYFKYPSLPQFTVDASEQVEKPPEVNF